jgi:kumamolisin
MVATGQQPPLEYDEYNDLYRPSRLDVAVVKQFARNASLVAEPVNWSRRTVDLTGTVAAINAAFKIQLQDYELHGVGYRSYDGPIMLPAADDLPEIITAVVGLDSRIGAESHCYRTESDTARAIEPELEAYRVADVARAYRFPTTGGQDECIALIEFNQPPQEEGYEGTGYRHQDLDLYFGEVVGSEVPSVKHVSVGNGDNYPGVNRITDGEVALDIQVAGTIAPDAKIVVYFAENTDQGFLDAVTRAVHDQTHKPSVISISWGKPESSWDRSIQSALNEVFMEAAVLGITVCCSSGDHGANDGGRKVDVHFPASSPWVLACGGTYMILGEDGEVTKEESWNRAAYAATGGGFSRAFRRPEWQRGPGVPRDSQGRGVPDVAAAADTAIGYKIVVDEQVEAIGGTSSVAPLYAGLVATLNQRLGRRLGFLNYHLYGNSVVRSAFRDITVGGTFSHHSNPGWDPCTGLGRADGKKLFRALERLRPPG